VFLGRTVALVLPTYNERDSIRKVIDEFDALGVIDDILVINNNFRGSREDQGARDPRDEARLRGRDPARLSRSRQRSGRRV
jgi:hypothetical protein